MKAVRHAAKFHSESFVLVPANAITIVSHLQNGLLISLGYLISRFEILSLSYFSILALVGVCALFNANFYLKIKEGSEPKA